MKKIVITKEDTEKFNDSINGSNKLLWKKIGCLIDVIATIGISLIIIFSEYLANMVVFYLLLYALLVIVVVGAEFIGTYYGALEQYVIDKKEKKELIYKD